MTRNIFLKAYTQINLGDDLFVKILCESFPDYKFIMMAPTVKSEPFKSIENLKVISSPVIIDKIFRKLKFKSTLSSLISRKIGERTDAVVHIGGSIFMQDENWKSKIYNYETEIKKSKEYYIIGSNFGPFKSSEYLEGYRKVFKQVSRVSFRDTYSYELFSELPQVEQYPDVIFGLDTEKIKTITGEKYVVLSIINLEKRMNLKEHIYEYEELIVTIGNKLINKGLNLKFMSFCSAEGDESAIQSFLTRFPKEKTDYYNYKGNLDEALSVLKSSSGIVATRFHAMILSWVFNKPNIPILYSDKMKNVIEDIKYPGEFADIRALKDVDVDKLLDNFNIPYEVDTILLKKNAKKHFQNL